MTVPQYRTALITGASAGIGAEFARQLAAQGSNIILVARRLDRLESLAEKLHQDHGIIAEAISADLSQTGDIERVGRKIAETDSLDLLVNNAGFGITEPYSSGPIEPHLSMIQVHVLASVRLSRAALTGMIARRRGGIINVASVAAFSPFSGVTYSATKAYLVNFSQALYNEILGSGVRVQALCPGFTYTEFHDVIQMDRTIIPRIAWLSAESVVRTSLKALRRGPVICVPSWRYRLIATLLRTPLTASLIQAIASQPAIRRRFKL